MRSDALNRLDEIERLDPALSSEEAAEAVELMSGLASGPREIRALIERYGGSPAAALANCLANLVSAPTRETAPLVFLLLEKLRRRDTAEVLVNCLAAIQNLLQAPSSWKPSGSPPTVFFTFIRHCLNYSLWRDRLVLSDAVAVVSIIETQGTVEETFTPPQLLWLREKIVNLRRAKWPRMELTFRGAEDFLGRADIFLHSPILERLDEINARADADSSAGRQEAFGLMAAFAGGPDDLWVLVERYGGSKTAAIANALSALMVERAESPDPALLPLIFYWSDMLPGADEPESITAGLSSLRSQLRFNHSWERRAQPSTAPFPLLLYSLKFYLRHEDAPHGVASEALGAVKTLYRLNALARVFNAPQLTALRDTLVELSLPRTRAPEFEMSWVGEFIAEEGVFVQPSVMARLDDIAGGEAAAPTGLDEEAFDLMEASAQSAGDVKLLVRRYADSPNASLINTLSLLVSRMAETNPPGILPELLFLMERLAERPHTGGVSLAQTYCLESVRQHVRLLPSPSLPARAPDVLYKFLTRCLDGGDEIQHYHALKLMSAFYQEGRPQDYFTPRQVASLRARASELLSLKDGLLPTLLGEELTRLAVVLRDAP